MTATQRPVDVLIVGGGPTGLMAACELLRRGVRVRLIDRNPAAVPFPKALLLWPRSLDLMEDLGAIDEIRAASIPISAFSYFSDRVPLARFAFPPDLTPLCLPQNSTERVLTDQLHKLGGTVERSVRLLAFDGLDYSGRLDATDDVTAILEHADGTVERFRAPFVIGADGAGSAVRAQIGTGFVGSTYEAAFALVDARIEGDLPPDEALYYQSPAGALVVVALPDGVYRFFSSLAPGEPVSVPLMQRIVDQRGPEGVKIKDPVWESVFRVHRRHAADFQLGRVFLAGDAAHVHSPAGGQGLNTGLQDAHNIAWKLAAVILGEAPLGLLAGYGAERQAVARRVVRDADIQTRGWMVKGRSQVAARDAAFRMLGGSGILTRYYAPVMAGRRFVYPVERGTQLPAKLAACRLLGRLPGRFQVGGLLPRGLSRAAGIAGPEADPMMWTLLAVSETRSDKLWYRTLAAEAADRPRLRLADIADSVAASATGCAHDGFYLVRPDGHVVAHGHRDDIAALRVELSLAFAPTNEKSEQSTQGRASR